MEGKVLPEIWERHFCAVWSQLERLLERSGAATAILIDRCGNAVTYAGEDPDFDLSTFASLAVADYLAAKAMADLLEDRDTRWVVHEGATEGLVMAPLHPTLVLAVLFDRRTTLGLVRYEIRRRRKDLEAVTGPLLALARQRRDETGGRSQEDFDRDEDERDLIGEGLAQLFGPSE